MNKYKERIDKLREYMKEQHVDVVCIPTNDFHSSEYVSDYFKLREYLTGFSGSAGELLVSMEEACLFTDGRYFLQAERELINSSVTLYRSGLPSVPTPVEKLCSMLPERGVFGFDGRLLPYQFVCSVKEQLAKKKVGINSNFTIPSSLWPNRPELTSEKAYRLPVSYCGQSTEEKLALVRNAMKRFSPEVVYKGAKVLPSGKTGNRKASIAVYSSLTDIAFLFNLRGNDVLYTPVVLSYALITKTEAFLYLLPSAVTKELEESFKKERVTIRPYDSIYEDVAKFEKTSVLFNAKVVNYSLASAFSKSNLLLSSAEPVLTAKAIRNPVEQNGLLKAHLKDGLAMTRFMFWLKKEVSSGKVTEYSAAEKLLSLKKETEGFVEPSFETISAYNENAAMMHYCAQKNDCAVLKPEGFLLVDSGSQYFDGTTDVTRTYVLGEVKQEWKRHYTAVLRGMLDLTAARFLSGCRGVNLDILARGPLWKLGLDYRCGTGHGVGFFLSVHEAPNGFRWKIVPERSDSCILTEGMVTTNEPGVYVEGSHGIRIENELLCKKAEKTEYGQYLCFETLTLTPIDLSAVIKSELTSEEKKTLNRYHEMVYQKLHSLLPKEEAVWLFEVTRPIK